MGIQFRFGSTPKEADIIIKKELPHNFVAGYFGQGVVFIKTPPRYTQRQMNLVLLHEIGHAVLDFFPLKISMKMHEIKANAIALGYAANLRIPVSEGFIQSVSKFTRMKGVAMRDLSDR